MTKDKITQIFHDTAYIRTGGSPAELKCAEYLKGLCAEFGTEAYLEPFEVDMSDMKKAVLTADGIEVPCKGYLCSGTHEVEAPLYYLRNTDACSLSQCKGKVVMIDGYMGYWKYQDILEHGAVGFITYDGNANFVDEDIDHRELRAYVSKGNKLPGVNINAKKAIEMIQNDVQMVKISIEQDEYKGTSQNVILDLPGTTDEWIVFTAHYDSTSLSQGAYDNMSGSIGLLAIAEDFTGKEHRYGLRFIWCGSEERGLLGSKAYAEAHKDELKQIVFNINLDMIGCIMGEFLACCTSEDKLCHYIEYFASMYGFGIRPYQDVYSSDSTPFADQGIPAVSFARIAPQNTAVIHNSYDTKKLMSAAQMEKDIAFILSFTEQMAQAVKLPVLREMPENMKEKLDVYLARKREKK